MSIKIYPDLCLWCDDSRVVDGKCTRCGTKYCIEKRQKTQRKKMYDGMTFGREELNRVRRMRFGWEIP